MNPEQHQKSIGILHAGGYVGRELIRLLLHHPAARLAAVTSRTFAGQPIGAAHPSLRGDSDLVFSHPDALDAVALDAVMVTAEHGRSAPLVQGLLNAGYDGAIVDLSADFRFPDSGLYERWFGMTHPAPELLEGFRYGLVETCAPYPAGTKWVANPGCFATGVALALWPLARALPSLEVSVTALTGASGSGIRPKATTHFPTRDSNVRAYKVLAHQHLPEIQQSLGSHANVAFVPVSGPWTRGIWGTAHIALPPDTGSDDVAAWYQHAYASAGCTRLWPDTLPELRYAAGTPYCDIGWVVEGRHLVVGFALDNLLKGAASQAVQNLNLLMGWPDTAGLVANKRAGQA